MDKSYFSLKSGFRKKLNFFSESPSHSIRRSKQRIIRHAEDDEEHEDEDGGDVECSQSYQLPSEPVEMRVLLLGR